MAEQIKTNTVAKNLMLSILAQLASIAIQLLLNFVVPKFIDEYQYAYWQTYHLYIGYVGIFHFGFLDGLILRYSQFNYEELDKSTMRSQFRLLLTTTGLLSIIGVIVSALCLDGVNKDIFILIAIGIIIKNVYTYTSYIFQITNRINLYAIFVIFYNVLYAGVVAVLLICKCQNYYWYCVSDLGCCVVAIILGNIFNKDICFGKGTSFKPAVKEYMQTVYAGVFLMIASYASDLIVGGAKMVVQWRWDTLIFGKVSFAFSVTSFFLRFVMAISIVLFPSLKRMNENDLPDFYIKLRDAISPLIFSAILFYFPICWILEKWLPNYLESLVYLGILLPIIIFSSKVSLLTNNYLKAYRKEKLMLIINLVAVILGICLALLCAYVLNNLDLLLYSVVIVVMLRSVVSEIVVMKIIHKKVWFDFIIEFIMTVVFIVVARYLSLWWGCLAYAIALIIYFVLYRKNLVAMLNMVKDVIQKRKAKKQGVEDKQKEIINDDDTPEK